jgi:putative glutamine amidotransferase
MSQGDLAVMIPSPEGDTQVGDAQITDYADWLDGVVLMGGSDVWPGSYGEEVMDPRWTGDRVRDAYEKKLIEAFVAAGKARFGCVPRHANDQRCVWRHLVSRHRHTKTRSADAQRWRAVRPQLARRCSSTPHSKLAQAAGRRHQSAKVNSIHHQGVKDLARQLCGGGLLPS